MKYIVNKYKPELKGKSPRDEAQGDMLGLLLGELKASITGPCYSGDKSLDEIKQIGLDGVKRFEQHLGDKKYLVGDNLLWVDFFFFEVIEQLEWQSGGDVYKVYPRLHAFRNRIHSLI